MLLQVEERTLCEFMLKTPVSALHRNLREELAEIIDNVIAEIRPEFSHPSVHSSQICFRRESAGETNKSPRFCLFYLSTSYI